MAARLRPRHRHLPGRNFVTLRSRPTSGAQGVGAHATAATGGGEYLTDTWCRAYRRDPARIEDMWHSMTADTAARP